MNIRKIQKEDLLTCSKILESAYSCAPYNETFLDGTAKHYIEKKYINCSNDSFVVLDENNSVIAFSFLTISSRATWPQAILEEIVVNPAHQWQWIGKQLLTHLHDYISTLWISSTMLRAKNNEKLIKFYEDQWYKVSDDFVMMYKN